MSNIGLIMGVVLAGVQWVSEANTEQTLLFDHGRVSGFAGCNRLSGNFLQQGDQVWISDIALTRKMCNLETMRQENDWVRMLQKAAFADRADGVLVLKDIDGKVLARLAEQQD